MSASRAPMLINLPPPPSDPMTPNEHGPGTPNSAVTSLSTLSVVAIKDGSIGHGRGAHPSANTLEAERADRISRLAGLERVATVRAATGASNQAGGGSGIDTGVPNFRERSTVGSASATDIDHGSMGGPTTWASETNETDKMSEADRYDQDDEVSSTSGFSDEDKASLVGFGEGAGSTVSGPVSTANARMIAARQVWMNQNAAAMNAPRTRWEMPFNAQQTIPRSESGGSTPMSGIVATGSAGERDPKMMDGMTYDAGVVDTTMLSTPGYNQQRQVNRSSGTGAEIAESIMRDRLNDTEQHRGMGTPDSQGLGKFPFEKDD